MINSVCDYTAQPLTAAPPLALKQLILGGARSGKSRIAEGLASSSGLPVTYIATAEAGDGEMRQRIAHHRQQRPAEWGLIEQPLQLAEALRQTAATDRCILVDCLTLWLSNLLGNDDEQLLETQQAALLQAVTELPGSIILVSNEVGLGIVPMNAQARRFRDLAGRLHQQLAERCDRVVFTLAGLPQVIKGPPLQLR